MKILRTLSALSIIGFLAIVGCAGGAKNDSKQTGLQTVNEPPAELLLKDKIKNYAAFIGKDAGEVEAKFNEVLGATPPSSFNADWFKFFTLTDPSFAGIESFLPSLWGQTLITSIRRPLLRRELILEEAGDGDAEAPADGEAEAKARFKEAVTGFNSFLSLLQGRFVQDAGFFNLSAAIAVPGMFPLPQNFFGTSEFDAEQKELMTKLLYSATLKVNDEFFSFFQFYQESSGTGTLERRFDFKLGKFTFIPAKENVLLKIREGGLRLRERGAGGSDQEILQLLR